MLKCECANGIHLSKEATVIVEFSKDNHKRFEGICLDNTTCDGMCNICRKKFVAQVARLLGVSDNVNKH